MAAINKRRAIALPRVCCQYSISWPLLLRSLKKLSIRMPKEGEVSQENAGVTHEVRYPGPNNRAESIIYHITLESTSTRHRTPRNRCLVDPHVSRPGGTHLATSFRFSDSKTGLAVRAAATSRSLDPLPRSVTVA